MNDPQRNWIKKVLLHKTSIHIEKLFTELLEKSTSWWRRGEYLICICSSVSVLNLCLKFLYSLSSILGWCAAVVMLLQVMTQACSGPASAVVPPASSSSQLQLMLQHPDTTHQGGASPADQENISQQEKYLNTNCWSLLRQKIKWSNNF